MATPPHATEDWKRRLGLPLRGVDAVLDLLEQKCTVPFIVRYRGDATGGLDEAAVLCVVKAREAETELVNRRAAILKLVTKANGTRPAVGSEVVAAIHGASTLAELEDIYAPFKGSRSTLAQAARGRGLAPLAEQVWCDSQLPDAVLRQRLGAEAPGVGHLLAEMVAESPSGRAVLRALFWRQATVEVSAVAEKQSDSTGKAAEERGGDGKGGKGGKVGGKSGKGGKGGKGGGGGKTDTLGIFDSLHGLSMRACELPAHRVLALNRGESLKKLRVAVRLDRERAVGALIGATLPRRKPGSERASLLEAAAADAYTRLLQPAMAREVRRRLTEEAAALSVRTFARNLEGLLMQRPVHDERYQTWIKPISLGPYVTRMLTKLWPPVIIAWQDPCHRPRLPSWLQGRGAR